MDTFAFLIPSLNLQKPQKSFETKKCPNELRNNGSTSSRSTCPWYNVSKHNEELFPSNWTEANCICKKCVDFDNNKFKCEAVLTPVIFLKRSKCIDGLYGYESYQMQIQTGCTCARKSTTMNNQNK